MINAVLDILDFLKSNFAFLFSLGLYTILAIVLYKSIKKHSKAYYWVFGVISFCFIIPSVARLTGITLPFKLGSLPIIGLSASELSSAANFIHPILVIIMYMGALNSKNQYVRRLMSIRKELSIIVGFPVLAHAVKRVFGTFPGGWQFFFDNETYMQSPRVSSALGSGITSFAFVLGLAMTILFLVLWITSFDSVHRKLGGRRWKKIQKWSYALYAMLFLHSLCLQVGGLISSNARATQQNEKPKMEVVANTPSHSHGAAQQGDSAKQVESSNNKQPQQVSHGHGRARSFAFADLQISRNTKSYINIIALLIIYGSYLYLRVRKARNKR